MAWIAPLPDGTNIEFAENRFTTAYRIDERNLKYCLYLHLGKSSITLLDTNSFSNLRVLVLFFCALKKLDTINLMNLVLLQIQGTDITELDTKPLRKL